jgi:hypothetical protein
MQLLGAAIGWVCIAAVVYLVLQFVRKHKTSTAVAVARAQAEAAANAEGGDAAALARSEGNTVAIHLHIGAGATEQETAAVLAQVSEIVEAKEARILPPAMPAVPVHVYTREHSEK